MAVPGLHVLTPSSIFVTGQNVLATTAGVQIMAEELDGEAEEEDEDGFVGEEGRFQRTHLRLPCRLRYR